MTQPAPLRADSFRWPALLFLGVLAACFLLYRPGLGGAFLFDDADTLSALGEGGGIRDAGRALAFVFGSDSGPSGRPLAMATFLLDADTWPADPIRFRVHNLVLHLLCGGVLALLAFRLGAIAGLTRARAGWAAVFGAALWILHPLWVSTVLYVIQRMAILAALFTLLGLYLYVAGRVALSEGARARGFARMTAGLALCTPLAVLSKENGVLLPVLALVLDITVLRALPCAPRDANLLRGWRAVFLHVPALALGVYLALRGFGVVGSFALRDFTPAQRLLTEARVLWDYVGAIAVPRLSSGGLFHDDYPLSTSVVAPWSTLPAVLLWIGAIGAGIALRRKAPLAAAAALFFVAGHLVESTTVALDLYFEHRNYLPASVPLALLAIGAVVWLGNARRPPTAPRAGAVIGVALLAVYGAMLLQQARLWSQPGLMAVTWAQQKPGSIRAQQYAALWLEERGRLDLAADRIGEALEHHPDSAMLRVQHLVLACQLGQARRESVEALPAFLAAGRLDMHLVRQMTVLGQIARAGGCPAVSHDDLAVLWDAALRSPAAAVAGGPAQRAGYELAALHLEAGRVAAALALLDRSYAAAPDVDAALNIAALLATHGCFRPALSVLAAGATLPPAGGLRAVAWHARRPRAAIEEMRGLIEADLAAAAPGAGPCDGRE